MVSDWIENDASKPIEERTKVYYRSLVWKVDVTFYHHNEATKEVIVSELVNVSSEGFTD